MPKIFDRPEKSSCRFLPGSLVEIPGGGVCRVLGQYGDEVKVFDGHQILFALVEGCTEADEVDRTRVERKKPSNRKKAMMNAEMFEDCASNGER